jgi:hypothetical protein
VSLPFCAFACDYFGRKKTLGFGACIILLGTGLQGGAQNSKFKLSRPVKLDINICRWHVHRRTRHNRIRTGFQHHRSADLDHGTSIPDTESTHGQHIQLAVESRCYCSCLDDLRNFPNHEHLGVENPFYPPGTVQLRPNPLFLVDCRIAPLACKQGPLRRSTSYHHQSKFPRMFGTKHITRQC